jgi:hypothetical protein
MKMEQTECSETSAYKIRAPGNYPEENIQYSVYYYYYYYYYYYTDWYLYVHVCFDKSE